MFGGTLEAGETPFEALLREAGEEESSGGLVQELRRQEPTFATVLVHMLGTPERQHLFEIRVDPETADGLVAHENESYGVERLPAAVFDSDAELNRRRRLFTPKSIAIFRALGRSI